MPRNMSFALTTEQVRDRKKHVTRRCGWWFLKPGEIVNAVEKAMGLRKGEKIARICQIRIVATRPERLDGITDADVLLEGFELLSPEEFVDLYARVNRCAADAIVNRIEFEYL